MQPRMFVLTVCAALPMVLAPARGDVAKAPAKLEHPGEVALIEEDQGYAYRHFPSGLHLYYSDRDPPGTSNCQKECAFAWPPLIAREGAKPMGDWTLVPRDNGNKQWAYKGHPIYLMFHDSTTEPQGDKAENGTWHILEP